MRKLVFLFVFVFIIFLVGCEKKNNNDFNDEEIIEGDISMDLYVDGIKLDVSWENNRSVIELSNLGDITIIMQRYGGFEVVGPIGQKIYSNDTNITTTPGDIMLYQSRQIVLFFGTNSYSYTRLGHINLNEEELNNLLNKESVLVEIK